MRVALPWHWPSATQVMVMDEEAMPLTRIWCIYEVLRTSATRRNFADKVGSHRWHGAFLRAHGESTDEQVQCSRLFAYIPF